MAFETTTTGHQPKNPIRHMRRIGITTALATAVVGTFGAVAWAWVTDNIVPTSGYHPECSQGGESSGVVCQTDNATWTYFRASTLESEDKANVVAVLNSEFSPTDLSVVHDPTPSYSGSAETDVIFQESYVPGSVEGITWCNDPIENTFACDQHYVDIEPGHYSERMICHEAGHAVGLLHGGESAPELEQDDPDLGCMRTPVVNATLGSNQAQNINATY